MNNIADSLPIAWSLVSGADPQLLRVVLLSLQVSSLACLFGALLGVLAGAALAVWRFPGQRALPMRQLGSFLPGEGVGGAMVHWNGQTWRFQPEWFELKSWVNQRYGANFLSEDVTIQDWGLTYGNPDFVMFAESFGAHGHRVESAAHLKEVLAHCRDTPGVHLIDCPVDYTENDQILNIDIKRLSKEL